MYIESIEITWETGGSSTTPSISADNVDITYDATSGEIAYTINNPVSGGSLVATSTATWISNFTYTDEKVTFSAEVNDAAERSATVTLTYTYGSESVTKNVTVTQAGNPNAPGTENNPYTVAQARAAIDAGTGVTGVYATGIVTAIPTAYNSSYGNITFNIVDNNGDTEYLQAYRCGGTDAANVLVGDIVVVKGNLTKYNSTYEFGQGCELVSLTHPAVSIEAPTFSPAAGSYADAQNVTISCATDGATIYYTTDGTEPTSSSTKYTAAISVTDYTTIKAIAIKGTDESTIATATYHICSAQNPYTVTEALAFSEYPANGIYVSGIVSTAPTQDPTTSGQMTYYISVNGDATNELQVYKGLGLNEAPFTAQDDIQVGDEVTIYGNVKVYNSTIEFDTNNYLVAFNRPVVTTPTITATPTSLTGFTYVVDNGPSAAKTLEISGINLTNNLSLTVDGEYFEVSLNENNGYTSIISSATDNLPTTIYVRLKAGLAAGDYNGSIVLKSEGADNVTVSLSGSVTEPAVDYAILPFNWAGGASADFLALNGVTANGLGTDYAASNAPYLIKFDTTDDYIQVKTDGQPGVVSIDVKMIGGASSSTITVQGSTNGTDFTDVQVLTISGAQNTVLSLETTNSFNDNDRYVRLVFTKGSNVGVGAISIAKPVAPSTDPVINANDIELEHDATSGEIAYTITNPATGVTLSATTTADWISNIAVDDDKVTFTTTENSGDADRTATITLTYTGAADKEVTVTQKHLVVDYATLPFSWVGSADEGSTQFKALDGVTANGLGSDYAASNAPYRLKLDGTGDYIQVKTDSKPLNVTLDVKMLGGSNDSKITVQSSSDGENFTDVEELTISGAQNDVLYFETTNAFGDNDKYVRLLFTKGSNVGVGAITINCVRKAISDAGYATYCSPYALDFTNVSGLTAYEATISGTTVTFVDVNDSEAGAADQLFAAGEGMLLKGAEGTYTIPVIASAPENTDNKFVGTITGEENVAAGIFVLMNQNNKVGFYKTKNPFTVGAHTAYLPAIAGARDFIGFDEDSTTGVEELKNSKIEELNSVYDLQGRRVNKAQKGMYIVNGKKVVIK